MSYGGDVYIGGALKDPLTDNIERATAGLMAGVGAPAEQRWLKQFTYAHYLSSTWFFDNIFRMGESGNVYFVGVEREPTFPFNQKSGFNEFLMVEHKTGGSHGCSPWRIFWYKFERPGIFVRPLAIQPYYHE